MLMMMMMMMMMMAMMMMAMMMMRRIMMIMVFVKVYLAQDVKHGFVALKTVDSQRMGVVRL